MLKMIKAWQCTEVCREAEAARFIGILVSKLWEHWINAHKIRPWVVPLLLVCCAWHEWKPQQKRLHEFQGTRSFCMLLATRISHSQIFLELCLQGLLINSHLAICLFGFFFITDFLIYTNDCTLLGKKI